MGVSGISLFTFYYQLGWKPFICFLAICDSSSVPILCSFFYWVFFSLLIWKSSLNLIRQLLPIDFIDCRYLFQVCNLSVNFDYVVFCAKVLNFIIQYISCFLYGLGFLACWLGNSAAMQFGKGICLHFLWKISKCWFLYIDLKFSWDLLLFMV